MKLKKLFAMLLVVFMMMSMVAGCGSSKDAASNPAPESPVQTADKNQPVQFTDSAGRTVELPAQITKIVPSGSLAQIVLFALAPDMFVGLSNKWSTDAEKFLDTKYYQLPVLGQFYGSGDLNLEEIARVDPQIIIDVGESKSTIKEDMDGIQNQLGIPTVHIEATTATMPAAYRTLGKLLGREAEGEKLAQYCEEIYGKTQDIVKAVGEAGKTKVLYCLGDNGLNIIGKGSFHAEILDLVSNNVATIENPSSKGTGDTVDMEQILLWDPDVILFAPGSIYATVGQDPAWQKLDAIKDGKYYEVPIGPYNWMGFPPSVQRYMGMIWITQLLYPEQAKYNVYDEAVRYYDLFYHSKLTDDQYKGLVGNSLLKQ